MAGLSLSYNILRVKSNTYLVDISSFPGLAVTIRILLSNQLLLPDLTERDQSTPLFFPSQVLGRV